METEWINFFRDCLPIFHDAVKILGGALVGGWFAMKMSAIAHKQKLNEELCRDLRLRLTEVAKEFSEIHEELVGVLTRIVMAGMIFRVPGYEERASQTLEGASDIKTLYAKKLSTFKVKLELFGFPLVANAFRDFSAAIFQFEDEISSKDQDWAQNRITAIRTHYATIQKLMAGAYRNPLQIPK